MMREGIVVDLFNADVDIIRSLRDDILNSHKQNLQMVAMRSTDNEVMDIYEHLKKEMMKCGVWVHSVSRNSKIYAFYDAKVLFDHYQIRTVSFYCLSQNVAYWKNLAQILLTSIHSWNFKSAGSESIVSVHHTALEQEVDAFLQHLSPIGNIEILKSKLIPNDAFVHGFSTRYGGISRVRGMQSLNLTFSAVKPDASVIINENRRRLAVAVGFSIDNFHIAKTAHGNSVYTLGENTPEDGYDAVITNKAGVVVGAPAADCLAFIFADPVRRVCAAAHAGWKGTLLGVVCKTVQTMTAKYGCEPKDILVAVGPSIQSCCFDYDLDEEDVTAFKDISPECVIWKDGHPKPFLNLQKANHILLMRANIQQKHIEDRALRVCTSCNPNRFFSFQRDGVPFGNQIGFIGITNTD